MQEGDGYPLQPHVSHTVLRREHSETPRCVYVCVWRGARRGHPQGRTREGKRWQAGCAGGTERGPGRAAAGRPWICLCISNYAQAEASPRLRRPLRSSRPQPHASPLGAEQEDHMEGIIRQLTFH